jgi:3'-phosphoadenosine 5'-phosphosulfate sulfotransferase
LNKALSLRKEITVVDLNQNPFYWQTWHYLDNPGQILESNLSEGIEDAALLLAACMIKEGAYDQARPMIQSMGQTNLRHQELWKRIRQKDLNRQPLTHELGVLLEEHIQVRPF